ncbi:MAG: hypothetical protein V3U24_00120 [Candidatus Neomarinimicrobiota bacterium]
MEFKLPGEHPALFLCPFLYAKGIPAGEDLPAPHRGWQAGKDEDLKILWRIVVEEIFLLVLGSFKG